MEKIKSKKYQVLVSFIMLTLGAILSAYALETFLIPNTILDGGVTGISIIISNSNSSFSISLTSKYSFYLYWI